MHLPAVPEADLDLGRMHIDIDPRRIDLHVQHIHRLPLAMQNVLVRAACRVAEDFVAYIAAVDISKLLVAPGTRGIGRAGVAPHADRCRTARPACRAFVFDRDGLRHEVAAENVGQPARLRLRAAAGAPLLDQFAVVPDRECHVGTDQRLAPYCVDAMRQLGCIGLQKLAPRRCGIEQFAHLDGGAAFARGGLQLAGAPVELPGVRIRCSARDQPHVCNRVDGRKCLAAKAQCADRFEVAQRRDLAGGVPAQRQRQFAAVDAGAVVLDRDQANAARLQPHRDRRRVGVKRVV